MFYWDSILLSVPLLELNFTNLLKWAFLIFEEVSHNFLIICHLSSKFSPLDIQKTDVLLIEGKTLQQNSLDITTVGIKFALLFFIAVGM